MQINQHIRKFDCHLPRVKSRYFIFCLVRDNCQTKLVQRTNEATSDGNLKTFEKMILNHSIFLLLLLPTFKTHVRHNCWP